MLVINRILLATALHESGSLASLAFQIAQAVGAKVHVVHAQESGAARHTAEAVASWVHHQTEHLTSCTEVPWVHGIVCGADKAASLAAYADAHNVDLVVLGAPQHKRAVPGISIAHQLIRRTMLPVLVCPRTMTHGEIASVLAPVDFSKPARHACLHAHALAELFGARLDVVHAMRGVVVPDALDLATSALQSSVASFCADALGADAEVQVTVRSGDPAACITAAACERSTDLIVLQTHGLAGVSRLAMGSVAKRVLHNAPCAVLMLRTYGRTLLRAARHHDAGPPVVA